MKIIKFALLTAALVFSLNIVNPVVSAKTEESIVAAKSSCQKNSLKTGVVIWFNAEKCFGFIHPSDQSEDLFVHCKSVQENGSKILKPLMGLAFNVAEGSGGKQAVDVRILADSRSPK